MVRGDMTLDKLHQVIQVVMGWEDAHLHQFVKYMGRSAGRGAAPRQQSSVFYVEPPEEKELTVADLAPGEKEKFFYEYDFGDSWMHELVAEKILPPDPGFKHPVCLSGANACPPEDCGGIYGFYTMLEAYSDPKHPEHEDTREWLGDDFDPEEFLPDVVNAVLKTMRV